ncbi:MAG: TetR/AcrR family transcriptional regulator [Pseudomonadales bacterium]
MTPLILAIRADLGTMTWLAPANVNNAPIMNPRSTTPDHRRMQIVQAVAEHLVREGFANSGIRALADSAGLSDRMLMYYFATKDDLLTDALRLLADHMRTNLEQLLPPRPTPPDTIITAILTAAKSPEQQGALRLWFELVGLAMRGQEPYRTAVREILNGWTAWIEARLRANQRARAPLLLAEIEGRLMVTLLQN